MQALAQNHFAQDSWQTPRNARTLAAYMALQNREIGERIAALRRAKGNPPQEIVAQRVNVSNRSYQSWEAGDTKPSWRNLSKLAKFYAVSEEFILLGEPETPELELTQLDRIEAKLDDIAAQIASSLERVSQLEKGLEAERLQVAVRVAEAAQQFDDIQTTMSRLLARLPA